jgi:pilus assembly protein CpaE
VTAHITLWLAGDWTGLEDVRAGIASAEGVAVCRSRDVRELQDAVAAARELTQAPVVVLADDVVPGLLEAALEAKVAEVLILPQSAAAIVFAAQKLAAGRVSRVAPAGDARIVTVFSPKGGTGKSVIATNLALALASRGRRTLLVDADLQFGDVAIMLGLEPERTLHDLLTAPGDLDAEKVAGYAVSHESGLNVLAAPLRPEDAELITDGRLVELLDAARAGYDVVVVDTAPFFHSTVLATLDRTDDLVLVTTPDVPTMKNVRLALQTLELLHFPQERTRIVLNRASSRLGLRAPQVASVLEREVAFELPDDEVVGIGVNRGTPAVAYRRQCPFAAAVERLADGLETGQQAPPQRRRRFALGRQS